MDVGSVIAENAARLLSSSADAIRRHDLESAAILIEKAFEYDPGIAPSYSFRCRKIVKRCCPQVLSKAKFPFTLSGFAEVCRELGYRRRRRRLLNRYIAVAPNARDRDVVLQSLQAHPARQAIISAVKIAIVWLRIRVRLRTRLRHVTHVLSTPRNKNSKRPMNVRS